MTENILNKEPYISFYHNVFTPEECDFVIDNSEKLNKFKKSGMYNTKLKQSEILDSRTSSSFVDEDSIFNGIRSKSYQLLKDKFSYINNFSIEHFEKTQIQRYHVGQYVASHMDYFNCGQYVTNNDKMATLIIYLNDNFSGGETTFDFLNIKVKPEKGSALFFNYDYNTNIKIKSKHGGLPVLEGTKYIITCWIREKPIMLYGNNQ